MNSSTRHLQRRGLSAATALCLALTMLVAAPGTARAHDSCAVPEPTATGLLGNLLAFVNVFSSFLETTEVECPDKFEDVQVKLHRDWVPDAEDGTDATTTQAAAAGPKTKADKTPTTQAKCKDGMAAEVFACDGVDIESHLSMAELGISRVNDIWGWTDAKGKRDYALLGSTTGTVFVDIHNPKKPKVLGILPTASSEGGSSWRDIKVYQDHAYIVSEHTNHGVQVFDLTRLRDWDGTYTIYDADAHYTGHGSAHNININEDSGFAYSVGAGPFSSLGQPNSLIIAEGPAAGNYLASGAAFGPAPTQAGVAGPVVLGMTGGGATTGCEPLVGFPAGSIALLDRGGCAFVVKAENAEAAGATALVVANNVPEGGVFTMGGGSDTTIPSIMISFEDGQVVRSGLPAEGSVVANDPPPACGDGLHMIDIRDPKNPVYAGCESETGYVHDTQCIIYDGPDTEFTGREICFNSNGIEYALNGENYVSIVDVTDKSAPVVLSRLAYDGSGYSHQGWLTEDRQYFLHGDEGDEILAAVNTTTRVWDVSDLRAPEVVNVFVNETTSIDHNLYTDGDLAYASNYTTGLRVYDVSDAGGAGPVEVGYLDIYPENDNASFEGGTWSNYPYFHKKDIVAVSSIDRGLFIVKAKANKLGK